MSKKMIGAMESSLADKMRDKGLKEASNEASEYANVGKKRIAQSGKQMSPAAFVRKKKRGR